MARNRTHHLITYNVSQAPMGEAVKFRALELRTADLRTMTSMLGATVAQVDDQYLSARRSDLHHCPVCDAASGAAA